LVCILMDPPGQRQRGERGILNHDNRYEEQRKDERY